MQEKKVVVVGGGEKGAPVPSLLSVLFSLFPTGDNI